MANQATLSIGEVVARLRADCDITESNLRFWEKQGLLDPRRTPGGHRTYTEADLERIRLIKRLQIDRHLPLAAIRRICRLAADHPEESAYLFDTVLAPAYPDGGPLTAAELAESSGLDRPTVTRLGDAGLLEPRPTDEGLRYGAEDLALCRMVADWLTFGFGIEGLLIRAQLARRYVHDEWQQLIRPKIDHLAAMPMPQRLRLKQAAEDLETLLFSTARRRLHDELWRNGELESLCCRSEEP